MRRYIAQGLLLGLIWTGLVGSVVAQELLMARSTTEFPEAMLRLQESVREHGYAVSRVQRVDIGLTKSGYATDKYRVVFFAKHDEVTALIDRYPHLAAYLPLQIVVFAEGKDTLFVATSPLVYQGMFSDPELALIFTHWKRDLDSIFDDLRTTQ